MFSRESIKKIAASLLLLGAAFLTGRGIALSTSDLREASAVLQPSEESWGLSFQEEGQPPAANASFEELRRYNAWYAQDTREKVIYLTFDAGLREWLHTRHSGRAEKNIRPPPPFFVVGNYISSCPDLVQRMVEEGHIVGNHTYSHPDMSQIATKEAFEKELSGVEQLYEDLIGEPMKKYYRPPQGKYSTANLEMARDMGYTTFFWSLAYVDWYQDDQPTKEEAFEKLLGRIHPGAIVLLHSTSSTNAEILDELLTRWEEMGYSFRSLEQLAG